MTAEEDSAGASFHGVTLPRFGGVLRGEN